MEEILHLEDVLLWIWLGYFNRMKMPNYSYINKLLEDNAPYSKQY